MVKPEDIDDAGTIDTGKRISKERLKQNLNIQDK